MGMVSVPVSHVPTIDLVYPGAAVMDAANEKVAFVFIAPANGNITAVEVRVSAVTTAKSLRVGLQALDASGDPDGTFLGAGAAGYGTIASPGATTTYQVSLGAAVAVTTGTSYAVVVKWTDDGDPGNVSIAVGTTTNAGPYAYYAFNQGTYVDHYTTAWAKQVYYCSVGILYGTTRYEMPWTPPVHSLTTFNLKSNSDPDEMGNRFLLPYGCRAIGAMCSIQTDGDIDFVLYSDAGSVLATATSETENRAAANVMPSLALFVSGGAAAPYTLSAGTWYRLVAKPKTTTNCAIYYGTFYEAASLGQLPLGTNCYKTVRTDAGSFTDDTASRVGISLVIDQISFPDAGNVQSDDTNTSVTGTLTLPTVGQVQSGVTYGAGGTEYEGTLSASSGGGPVYHKQIGLGGIS